MPSTLSIECQPTHQGQVAPTPSLRLQSLAGKEDYTLRAIIYYGMFHFAARLIDSSLAAGELHWQYDGRKFDGRPVKTTLSQPEDLLSLNGMPAYIYVYMVRFYLEFCAVLIMSKAQLNPPPPSSAMTSHGTPLALVPADLRNSVCLLETQGLRPAGSGRG